MTTPILSPVSTFSAIFQGRAASRNPVVDAAHPQVGRNTARIKVPKGVSTVMISTTYQGAYTVSHQDAGSVSAALIRNVFSKSGGGGGVFQVHALTEGTDIFINTGANMVDADTDKTWGLIVTTFQ